MNKKESSYYRLYRFAFIIALSLVAILGAVMISFCSSEYKKEQLKDLESVTKIYIGYVSDEYDRYGNGFTDSAQRLGNVFAGKYNIRLYLYDEQGNCIVSADDGSSGVPPLSESMKSGLDKEDYLSINSAALSLSEPSMMFGSKLFLTQGRGQYSAAYVLAFGGTGDLNLFTLKIALLYILLSALAMTICYILLMNKCNKHIKFENRFLEIIEQYSRGNFTEKISTDLSPNLQHISAYVNAIAANVEKSEEKSSTFIANVSHELRTPMTTIGGFVDGILDGTIKKSRQQEYLVLVSQEIQRLRILISSMLNMSKFESGTMSPNFRETNLTDLVIKIVLMFEKRIEEKNLQVEELDSSRLMAVCDADLMQQVIYNIVENAVKFVNEGGTLSFSFEKKNNICIVGIRNTGEGLQDSEIRQVFDRFYKTDSSRGKDTTGLGLGLSISRKIVHLHNGHIVVKSVYGEYTEFQIQIPEDPRTTDRTKKL